MERFQSGYSVYKDLPLYAGYREIRLLSIAQSPWSGQITCNLVKTSLNFRPAYRTLSYTWGDATHKQTILLNGYSFQVTRNLAQALRRIRDIGGHQWYWWIDAVCIDQSNVGERNQQVAIMRDIYSLCTEVLVYLGELPSGNPFDVAPGEIPREDTKRVVWYGDARDNDALDSFWDYFIIGEDSEFQVKSIDQFDHTFHAFALIRLLAADRHLQELPPCVSWKRAFKNPYCMAVADALRGIGDSPWWIRTWTVQEYVLSPKATVLYGPVIAPMSMFYSALERFGIHSHTCCLHVKIAMNVGQRIVRIVPDDMDAMESLRQFFVQGVRNEGIKHWHLFRLCAKFGARASSEDVDKIFSLLGLVTDWAEREPIMPDYRLSAASLYRRVTLDTILPDSTLDALIGDLEKRNHPELPSWVIDWSNRNIEDVDCHRKQLINQYSATAGREATIQVYQFDILAVTGFQVDWVSAVVDPLKYRFKSRPPDTIASDQKALTQFYLMAGMDQKPDRPYPGGDTYRNAYWRTLCGDCIGPTKLEGQNIIPTYRRAQPSDMTFFADWATCTCHSPFMDGPNGLTTERSATFKDIPGFEELRDFAKDDRGKRSFQKSMSASVKNRRLFISQGGLLGIGHARNQPGDEIFLLIGGRTPFVLRPTGRMTQKSLESSPQALQPNRPLYGLIGDCYVHGIMDGEAMQAPHIREDYVYLV